MKNIMSLILSIIFINFYLFSLEQNKIEVLPSFSSDKISRNELSISFEYENFPQKYYLIENQEKYISGVWASYRNNQKEDLITHNIISTKISLLTPIVSNRLFGGIEIGFGFPIKNYIKSYDIPSLSYDLDGLFSFPLSSSIDENYSQRISIENKTYLIPMGFP